MAAILAYLPLALVIGGVVKAAAILWVGPRLGIPALAVAAIAVLWVVGPAGGALLWRRKTRQRECDGATVAG